MLAGFLFDRREAYLVLEPSIWQEREASLGPVAAPLTPGYQPSAISSYLLASAERRFTNDALMTETNVVDVTAVVS